MTDLVSRYRLKVDVRTVQVARCKSERKLRVESNRGIRTRNDKPQGLGVRLRENYIGVKSKA